MNQRYLTYARQWVEHELAAIESAIEIEPDKWLKGLLQARKLELIRDLREIKGLMDE